MRTTSTVALAALALVSSAVLPPETARTRTAAQPARLVRAEIAVDGQVVLRASTSDDGRPDADAVWSYLERLEFEPTEAFSALDVDPAAEAVTLGWLRSRENDHRGEPPAIRLEIAYGGHDAPFRLGLVRSAGKATWRVDRETLERRFPHRRITRAQAARLTEPHRREYPDEEKR